MRPTIDAFLEQIVKRAEETYRKDQFLNSLVIIDEAHRLTPRQTQENEDLEAVKNTPIDAIRTTRKYGLGWMFISQTISSLHRDIINQIRIYLFGFGLGWGTEKDALQELIGSQNESMSLYQRFRDPQSQPKRKRILPHKLRTNIPTILLRHTPILQRTPLPNRVHQIKPTKTINFFTMNQLKQRFQSKQPHIPTNFIENRRQETKAYIIQLTT